MVDLKGNLLLNKDHLDNLYYVHIGPLIIWRLVYRFGVHVSVLLFLVCTVNAYRCTQRETGE